jgi:conjugative transfer region protein TrbK
MDGKMLTKLGAIIFVAFATTATAIDLTRNNQPATTQRGPVVDPQTPHDDPLRDTLARCQGLGEAATSNNDCLAAWAENRRRFLGLAERR